MKLLTKFVLATVSIFIILAFAISYVSIKWINSNTINDAQHRVELTMKSARDIFNKKNDSTLQLLEVFAQNEVLRDYLKNPSDKELSEKVMERFRNLRISYNMDILNIISPDGTVMMRTRPPFNKGDDVSDDPIVKNVLKKKKSVKGVYVLTKSLLMDEGTSLYQRTIDTTGESDAMIMGTAIPVMHGEKMIGIISAGFLLNGNNDLVDEIRDSILYGDYYKGRSVNTVTIFMGDKRIATNVVGENAGRATGTRASEKIVSTVMQNGDPWTGRAWVVDAWYLSRYESIRNPDGGIIGMLYVGELEEKYRDIRFKAVTSILSVILAAMVFSILVFTFIAWGILVPVKNLHNATLMLMNGDRKARIKGNYSGEIGHLTNSFNNMANDIEKHTLEIEKKQKELAALNNELELTNRNYIDMLGFVSHELKNPLASAVMGLHTVKDGYLGELNEKQLKALNSVAESLDYFKDLIKNYLDLSRLEKGEYIVQRQNIFLKNAVIDPVLQQFTEEFKSRHISIDLGVHDDTKVDADPDLLRIVYDNLISNAVKYGKEGGVIRLREKIVDGRFVFSVYNEGVGIPKEKMTLLFKKFSRIYRAEHAGKRGTGLGLYSCHEIIKKHGGKIWAESVPDKWVEFSFEIG
ncbi:MAG TPA: cache domain-containing protein [bacterium]|jgi:two-component system NtrC family sensor kinase|nr:cache domain-containing protein [bacterium]MDX9805211.1 cache domain-containing protein [bacterium]HOG43598.1 cache domain-containing protein [bacterium]HPG35011.1 cache domain-containing protein [bacterium]HPM46645.1 cache domain-containing protein [bacterium]